jgi:hypothetical protein
MVTKIQAASYLSDTQEHRQGPSQLSAQGEEMGPHPTPARPFRAPEGIEKTTRAEISALVNHNAISLHPV